LIEEGVRCLFRGVGAVGCPDYGLEWQPHEIVVVEGGDVEAFIEKVEHVGVGEAAGLERYVGHALDGIVDDVCQRRLGQESIEPYFRRTGSLLGAFCPGPSRFTGRVKRTRLGGYTRVFGAAALARFYRREKSTFALFALQYDTYF
jgi:hypothetical protein